jgi:hypothetical protein
MRASERCDIVVVVVVVIVTVSPAPPPLMDAWFESDRVRDLLGAYHFVLETLTRWEGEARPTSVQPVPNRRLNPLYDDMPSTPFEVTLTAYGRPLGLEEEPVDLRKLVRLMAEMTEVEGLPVAPLAPPPSEPSAAARHEWEKLAQRVDLGETTTDAYRTWRHDVRHYTLGLATTTTDRSPAPPDYENTEPFWRIYMKLQAAATRQPDHHISHIVLLRWALDILTQPAHPVRVRTKEGLDVVVALRVLDERPVGVAPTTTPPTPMDRFAHLPTVWVELLVTDGGGAAVPPTPAVVYRFVQATQRVMLRSTSPLLAHLCVVTKHRPTGATLVSVREIFLAHGAWRASAGLLARMAAWRFVANGYYAWSTPFALVMAGMEAAFEKLEGATDPISIRDYGAVGSVTERTLTDDQRHKRARYLRKNWRFHFTFFQRRLFDLQRGGLMAPLPSRFFPEDIKCLTLKTRQQPEAMRAYYPSQRVWPADVDLTAEATTALRAHLEAQFDVAGEPRVFIVDGHGDGTAGADDTDRDGAIERAYLYNAFIMDVASVYGHVIVWSDEWLNGAARGFVVFSRPADVRWEIRQLTTFGQYPQYPLVTYDVGTPTKSATRGLFPALYVFERTYMYVPSHRVRGDINRRFLTDTLPVALSTNRPPGRVHPQNPVYEAKRRRDAERAAAKRAAERAAERAAAKRAPDEAAAGDQPEPKRQRTEACLLCNATFEAAHEDDNVALCCPPCRGSGSSI